MQTKGYYFLLLIFLLGNQFFAQDIDIYHKAKNDNYELPKIHPEMSFEEFELLSQQVKMKDMFYAVIVPGHMHFKAKEPKKAYWLLGIRTVSYVSIAVAVIDAETKYGGLSHINNIKNSDKTLYQTLIYSGITLASASYFYDMIHGEKMLSLKQEKIRYKYTIKLQSQTLLDQKTLNYPVVSFAYNF